MTYQYFINGITKYYATFEGRARRSEYWYFVLFNLILSLIITAIELSITNQTQDTISTIYSFATFVPSCAVGVRRMHDVGKNGWYFIIPFYNLYLCCTDGEYGSNEYGDNPKGLGNQSSDEQAIKSIGTSV
jgi:uncharacterized membrane protein YhaH (DUF805 family)